VAKDLVLGLRDTEGFLLQGVGTAVGDEEPDEMAGGTDGQVTELQRLRRPRLEGPIPRKVEQGAGAVAQPELRERTGEWWLGQSFLRRYAATVASYPSDSYR
jgi:hypothetical protein